MADVHVMGRTEDDRARNPARGLEPTAIVIDELQEIDDSIFDPLNEARDKVAASASFRRTIVALERLNASRSAA